MGEMPLMDSILCDGLTDAFHNYHMGVTGKADTAEDRLTVKRCPKGHVIISSAGAFLFKVRDHVLIILYH